MPAARLLLVEDEPGLQLALNDRLAAEGYRVETAADGDVAVERATSESFDLILLDVMLPKRDGFDVCQTIRANPRWTGVRVIMLTAKGRDIEREKGMAMGADDYITKPFSTKEVVARVEKVLGPAAGSRDE